MAHSSRELPDGAGCPQPAGPPRGQTGARNPQARLTEIDSAVPSVLAPPLLTATGIRKSYSTVVLDAVDFTLLAGEVHALVGENGAGKSTLSRIFAGLTRPDAGAMKLRGLPYAPPSKIEAERRGVRMVLQELNTIPTLSIAESIFLGHLPARWGWIQYARLHAAARPLMDQVGLAGLHPATPISQLGVGQQQLVEIAAGLSQRCEVLILDEPTAALTQPEIVRLFAQIARLKSQGVGILYISHRLEEIQQLADRVTVLRDGHLMATRPVRSLPLEDIVKLMVGRELGQAVPRRSRAPGPVALRVEGLAREPAVRDVSFSLCRGEILGFAGLMGSGRTETMRAIFAADRPDRGRIFLHGSTQPRVLRSPRDAVQAGIALLTEDRKAQGLLLPLSVRANITLARMQSVSHRAGWVRREVEGRTASNWVRALSVRCASADQRAQELSGGNQQKVIMARWLLRNCDILIFDEPTRGIDVGAKFEIYERLAELAASGKAIIMVSSDLKELLACCDRIAVMSAGRLAAEFDRNHFSQDAIMTAALSGYLGSSTVRV